MPGLKLGRSQWVSARCETRTGGGLFVLHVPERGDVAVSSLTFFDDRVLPDLRKSKGLPGRRSPPTNPVVYRHLLLLWLVVTLAVDARDILHVAPER